VQWYTEKYVNRRTVGPLGDLNQAPYEYKCNV